MMSDDQKMEHQLTDMPVWQNIMNKKNKDIYLIRIFLENKILIKSKCHLSMMDVLHS